MEDKNKMYDDDDDCKYILILYTFIQTPTKRSQLIKYTLIPLAFLIIMYQGKKKKGHDDEEEKGFDFGEVSLADMENQTTRTLLEDDNFDF